ncbi:myomesin-2-like [Lethenteron reissneri]|uniref:myomesin-2-like n=1 Tax=Lethenteron reissneri TaxID=7753 RepID=UPI002AB7972A|nr:myomesin-2-like [Lethenteron reissneri]
MASSTSSASYFKQKHRQYDHQYRSKQVQSVLQEYGSESRQAEHSRKKFIVYIDGGSGLSDLDSLSIATSRHPTHSSILSKSMVGSGSIGVSERNVGLMHQEGRSSAASHSRVSSSSSSMSSRQSSSSSSSKVASSSFRSAEEILSSKRHATRDYSESAAIKKVHAESESYLSQVIDGTMHRVPQFLVKPRSHSVWEKSSTRFMCTVQGFPEPYVKWYKNHIQIDPRCSAGKYEVYGNYGVYTLEINRCDLDDTAQYKAFAMNVNGEASTIATLVVKRYQGEAELAQPGSVWLPIHIPPLLPLPYTKVDITIFDKFDVSFGQEGEGVTLSCKVLLHPNLKRFQPEMQWWRDEARVVDSQWAQTYWSGEKATLSLPHLHKDDEGLYTLRVVSRGCSQQHSSYLFVRDGKAEVAGAPAAALDVECQESNRNYVLLSWKPPSAEGGSHVVGYYIERCEVGTKNWVKCNDAPVRFTRHPVVTGLTEGKSYQYRVRAVNKAGMGAPSRPTEPIPAVDPADLGEPAAPTAGEITVQQGEPKGAAVPAPPMDVVVVEASRNYAVIAWKPPSQGSEGLKYFVERLVGGTDSWQRLNAEVPARSPRFAVFDLADGKSYSFRVLASNAGGVSEPSRPTGPINGGTTVAQPSSPGRILASRNSKTSVAVSWEASKHSQGLIGYYIESSLVGSDRWVPCNNKPVKYTRFVVHGLETGQKYAFRVRAVNTAGFSDFSQESDAVTVLPPIVSPSPPHGITLLNSQKDGMVLGWKEPTFLGGASVTHYYVDYCEVVAGEAGEWNEAKTQSMGERVCKISGLEDSKEYQFRIRAENLAGVGDVSKPSSAFLFKEWNFPEPGPPFDVVFTEVRAKSIVVLWKAPLYTGKSPVTGFNVEITEDTLEEHWQLVNTDLVSKRYYKVKNLEEGKAYRFRVNAVNASGAGKYSVHSDPVVAATPVGSRDAQLQIDDDGNIYLEYTCEAATEASSFSWSKNYHELPENKVTPETLGQTTKLFFNNPTMDDLGNYSCVVTATDGYATSYNLTEDELKRALETSQKLKYPTIPLRSELAVELLEKGQVRLWMQARHLSPTCELKFIVNQRDVSKNEKYKIHVDRSTGMIEMIIDHLSAVDEGTYTVQLKDGKAAKQSSLVLIGDVFKKLLEAAESQRKEWLRKQGPHFIEYLSWNVSKDCQVHLNFQIANFKKETTVLWFKDGSILAGAHTEFKDGHGSLLIQECTKENKGLYKVEVKDERGTDVSVLDIAGKELEDLMCQVCKMSALSATPLQFEATAQGVKIHSSVVYYCEDLKVTWYQKETKLSSTEKTIIGVSGEMLWMHLIAPTEKDKGKYVLELHDGKEAHKLAVDFSGEVYDEVMRLYQALKEAAFAETHRARVVGGLPDVVTIMEGKTLNLTCNVAGDPTPEVSWLKNDRELPIDDHLSVTLESGQYASIIVRNIAMIDSGKYTIYVKNKYGSESCHFTVSVYNHDQPPPSVKVPPGSVQAPPSSAKSPPSSVKAPPSSVKAPPSSVKSPPSSVKAPLSSVKAPAHKK